MKKIYTLLFITGTLFFLNSCAYECSFDLLGTSVKYNKLLLGSFTCDGSTLTVDRIDDYKVKVNYNNEEEDIELKDCIARFTRNGDKLYVVLKNEDKFIVGRINEINKKGISVNMLDADEDEVGVTKTFPSAAAFTKFVYSNHSIFSEEYDVTYLRQ